jgi:SET domain-containing protein
MLQVRTYVDRSPIQGLGLFAAEDIPVGTIIWALSGADNVLHRHQVACMSQIERVFITKYSFKINGLYYLCVDDARFMNHSTSPNTSDLNDCTVASRDISKGDELTCDYSQFDDEFDPAGFA